MRLPLTILAAMLILSIALLGALGWAMRQPRLWVPQLLPLVTPYGVESLTLADGRVTIDGAIALQGLRVTGTADDYHYDVKLPNVTGSWSRALLKGELDALTLTDAHVQLTNRRLDAGAAPDDAAELNLDEWRPATLRDLLPVKRLSVEQARLTLTGFSANEPALSIRLQALIDAGIELSVTSGSDEANATWAPRHPLRLQVVALGGAATANATLQSTTPDGWQWQVEAQSQIPVLARFIPTSGYELPPGDARVEATLTHTAQLALTSRVDPETMAALVKVNGTLQWSVTSAAPVPGIEFNQLAGHADLSWRAPDLQVDLADLVFAGSITPERLALPEHVATHLGWQSASQLDIALETLGVTAKDLFTAGSFDIKAQGLVISLGNRESRGVANFEALSFQLDPADGWPAASQLKAKLDLTLRRRLVPQLELTWQQRADGLAGDWHVIDLDRSLELEVASILSPGLDAGEHNAVLRTLDLPAATAWLLPLVAGLTDSELNLLLDAGSATLNTQWRHMTQDGQSTLEHESRALLTGIAGQVADYRFDGLRLSAGAKGYPEWRSLGDWQLSLDRLNVGFDMSQLSARLEVARTRNSVPSALTIDTLQAGVLGGRAWLPEPLPWDFDADENTLRLQAEALQLSQIVALQSDQQISATGELYGELPLTIRNGQLSIDGGYLRSREPGGRIAYVANEAARTVAGNNAELGLALDLLTDFNYRQLGSEVALDRDGNLLLGLSLAGHNPGQFSGRAVQFNINLEQNLGPLLQSLRLRDKLLEDMTRGQR